VYHNVHTRSANTGSPSIVGKALVKGSKIGAQVGQPQMPCLKVATSLDLCQTYMKHIPLSFLHAFEVQRGVECMILPKTGIAASQVDHKGDKNTARD